LEKKELYFLLKKHHLKTYNSENLEINNGSEQKWL